MEGLHASLLLFVLRTAPGTSALTLQGKHNSRMTAGNRLHLYRPSCFCQAQRKTYATLVVVAVVVAVGAVVVIAIVLVNVIVLANVIIFAVLVVAVVVC